MKFILLIFKLYLISFILGEYDNTILYIMNTHATNINYNKQININKNIKQLHQISNAHSQCLIQIQQQLSENQRDIDILRGHIQDMQHHISEIINNQKELNQKLLNTTLNKNNNNNMHYYNDISPKISVSESTKNTQKHKTNNNTIKINMDSEYKKAVTLVLEKKQYDQAIQAFQNFIQNYPKSDYESNSHYWLGQLFYNKGNKNNASYHFAVVVKNYPKSLKAPDALLKIGIIMQETEKKEQAKTIYKQVGKLYPNSDAAKQAQKRLLHL